MILQAAAEFDIDLASSVMVGDKVTDIQAGIAAGVGRNLLYSNMPEAILHESASICCTGDLAQIKIKLLD